MPIPYKLKIESAPPKQQKFESGEWYFSIENLSFVITIKDNILGWS